MIKSPRPTLSRDRNHEAIKAQVALINSSHNKGEIHYDKENCTVNANKPCPECGCAMDFRNNLWERGAIAYVLSDTPIYLPDEATPLSPLEFQCMGCDYTVPIE